MSKLNKILASMSLFVAFCLSAPMAMGQEVVVMDTARIFLESKGGQDVTNKVNQIGQQMQSELAPEKSALQREKASLDARLQGMTQEQVRADQALVAQGQAYTNKLTTFAQKSDSRARQLAATETAALRQFGQQLQAATETVRVRRGASLVLDRTSVYVMDPSIDITNDVIAELDRIAPSINVQRAPVPAQPQASNQ